MLKLNEKAMITVVPFWMDLSAGIFDLAAPLMVIDLGGNPIELGLIGTITASVHMVLTNLAGRLPDRFGRRVIMLSCNQKSLTLLLTNLLLCGKFLPQIPLN